MSDNGFLFAAIFIVGLFVAAWLLATYNTRKDKKK